MRNFPAILVCTFVLGSLLAWNLAGPASEHDWTLGLPVTASGHLEVYTYGIRQTEYLGSQTWIFYGPDFLILTVPFWRVIGLGFVSVMVSGGALGGGRWKYHRRA